MFIIFSNAAFAENICPTEEHPQWDKMQESHFSQAKALEKLEELKKVFNGETEVAEEFIWQANTILRGSFLLQEVHRLKDSPEYLVYAKADFCDFMAKYAYLVH